MSFYHELFISPPTQLKVLPRDDKFVNGWGCSPEFFPSNS